MTFLREARHSRSYLNGKGMGPRFSRESIGLLHNARNINAGKFPLRVVVSPYDRHHVRVGGHDLFEVAFVVENNDLIEPVWPESV